MFYHCFIDYNSLCIKLLWRIQSSRLTKNLDNQTIIKVLFLHIFKSIMKQTFAKALRAVMITLLTIHMVSCEQFYIFDTEGSPSTTDNHPQAVDLGLSVNWASCNLGATSPEECGDYYAWGETEKKAQYTQETYIYANDIDGDGDVDKYTDIGSDICGTMYDVSRQIRRGLAYAHRGGNRRTLRKMHLGMGHNKWHQWTNSDRFEREIHFSTGCRRDV
jgi:hypothetical protein